MRVFCVIHVYVEKNLIISLIGWPKVFFYFSFAPHTHTYEKACKTSLCKSSYACFDFGTGYYRAYKGRLSNLLFVQTAIQVYCNFIYIRLAFFRQDVKYWARAWLVHTVRGHPKTTTFNIFLLCWIPKYLPVNIFDRELRFKALKICMLLPLFIHFFHRTLSGARSHYPYVR